VSWDARLQKWRAYVYVQGVQKDIGSFDNKEAAARAFDKAAIEHGCLNRLNFEGYDLSETASASPALQLGSSRSWGVSWDAKSKKWRAYVYVQGVQNNPGSLTTRKLRRGPTTRLPSSEAGLTSSTSTIILSYMKRQ
jgi:hypothetical protein